MADVREVESVEPTRAMILADPSASRALKTVVLEWSRRDCVDAARDAEILCRLFASEADARLRRSS